MLKQNNKLVRDALKLHDMRQWELAELLRITEATLSKWLRRELPEEVQKEIVEIIEKGAR